MGMARRWVLSMLCALVDTARRRGRARSAAMAISALIVVCGTLSAAGASGDQGAAGAASGRAAHRGGPAKRDEVGAAAAAAGADPSGREVVERRTATSRTWKTSDGRFHTRVFPEPVNFKDQAGDWHPIDDTLVSDSAPGYALENRADSYRVQFPNNLGDSPITVDAGHDSVGFRLRGADGEPVASDDTARFKDVLPGVSAAYSAGPSVVKEDLTLADAHAPATYSYALDLGDGLHAQENDQGGIDVVRRDGSVRFTFEAPFATDHSGARIDSGDRIALHLDRENGKAIMRLEIDPNWLGASDRDYPVVVDPGLTVADNLDCYIAGGTSANTNFCGGSSVKVGWDGTKAYRSLLRFDVAGSVPANSVIAGAHMAIYLSSKTTSNTTSVAAHRVTHSWTSAATWNKYDGTNAWAGAGGDYAGTAEYTNAAASGSTSTWYTFGVSNVVQQWIDGTAPNYGLLLKEPTENVNNVLSYGAATSANAPYIQVDWEPKFMGDQPWYPMVGFPLSDRQSIAVNADGGNLVASSTDLQIAGVGLPLAINRTYNNLSPDMDSWGYGWSVNGGFDMWLDQYVDGQTFYDPTGTPFHFTKNPDGSYTTPPGINATLKTNGDGTNSVTYNDSGVRFNFDDDGDKLNSIVDKNGRTVSLTYNADLSVNTMTDTEGRTITFGYDTGSFRPRINKITDSSGRHVDYTYYPSGGPLKTFTDGAGKTTTYSYDVDSDLTQITDGAGNITKITYDASYRVASIKRVTDNTTLAGDTTTFTYNSGNTVVTDPNGHATTYAFDSAGRETDVTDALGHKSSQSWTSNNQPQDFTSPANQSTGKFEHNLYDSNRNLKETDGPDNASAGPQTTWSYNLGGAHPSFPDSAANPQAQTLNFSYDSTTAASPNLTSVGVFGETGLLANYTYSTTVSGQIDKSTDANGHDTTYAYETLSPYSSGGGDLKTITPPLPQGATTLGHDSLSRITSVKDGLLQTTTYHYDGDDRVDRIDYPDSTYVTYTYDGDGNITQVYDSNGPQTETYNYDLKNRLTSDSGPAGSDTYTYDAADNLRTLADGGGTVTYAYDDSDNLCWTYVGSSANSCTSPPSGATTFSYNSNDDRTHTVYPGGVDMATTYDNGDRITEIKATKSGVSTPVTDFTYTYLEGTTDRDRRSSVLDTGNGNNNKTFYTYWGKGFLREAQTKDSGGTGTVVSDLGYTYDANGNLCWTYPGNPPTGTGIDCGHPPTGTTKTYTYDNANELCWSASGPSTNSCSTAPAGATTFSFDADGQQTAQSGRGSLTWNKRHQATSLFGTSMGYIGADNTLRLSAATSTFKYNSLGLGTKTAGGSSSYYTRDPGGQLLSDRTTAGTYNYLFDGLGSVVALTDSTGAVAKRYTYDPYGAVTPGTGSVDNPWQYASGYWDSSAGTVKFGARYYDPSIARWTQPDPIDQAGIRSANDYLYSGCDPINNSDPSGLVRAKTPHGRWLERNCDRHRDEAYGEYARTTIGDFTGYIHRERATGKKYRRPPAWSYELEYRNPFGEYYTCHIIDRGYKILHGPHFRRGSPPHYL